MWSENEVDPIVSADFHSACKLPHRERVLEELAVQPKTLKKCLYLENFISNLLPDFTAILKLLSELHFTIFE